MSQRQPRLHDDGFLRFLRKKPCIICRKIAPADAAHIRFASAIYDKRYTGMAEKPDDKWAVPMCREHHAMQHGMNENDFWRDAMIDPLHFAQGYYAEYGGDGGHPRKKRKPRITIKPKGFGTNRKIPQGKTKWAKGRKISNRGFSVSSRSGKPR